MTAINEVHVDFSFYVHGSLCTVFLYLECAKTVHIAGSFLTIAGKDSQLN